MASQEEIYAAQVALYNSQIVKQNALIKSTQSKANATKDKKKKVSYGTQIENSKRIIQSSSEKRTQFQNKLYESRGQYEKLLSGPSRDAYLALNTLFTGYGLGSLAGKVYGYIKEGYSSDTISVLLQDTSEYKERFKANEQRRKKGLPVLSPAEYLSAETSYRQLMRQSGLPEGFYDTNGDFTGFLEKDVSPTELQGRLDLATQATALANPEYKKALSAMGIDDSLAAAYFLDPSRAMPLLQKAAATAQIGAEAMRRKLTFDQAYSENLATQGVTREDAARGYTQIGEEYGTLQGLGNIYGGGWTQRQAEQAAFEGISQATEQKRRLIGQERGAFSGSAGGAKGGLAQTGGAR